MYSSNLLIRLAAVVVVMVIFAGYFGYLTSSQNKMRDRCSAVTTGVVTDYSVTHRRHQRRNSSITGTVTVRYEVNGVSYTCEGTTSGHKEMGAHLEVYYDPGDPSTAYADKGPVINKTVLYAFTGLAVAVVFGLTVVSRMKRNSSYY